MRGVLTRPEAVPGCSEGNRSAGGEEYMSLAGEEREAAVRRCEVGGKSE